MDTPEDIVERFLRRERFMAGNIISNGKTLRLFENVIAKFKGNEVWITDAGFKTRTTGRYLSGFPAVELKREQKVRLDKNGRFDSMNSRYQWYLDGQKWNGKWARVYDSIVDLRQVAAQNTLSSNTQNEYQKPQEKRINKIKMPKEKTSDAPNGYIGFYKNKRAECYAKTILDAQKELAIMLGAKKYYDVSVHLAEKDGETVTHVADF